MIAPGFERVEEVFNEKAALQAQGGLAFAATRNGEPIVDLVAGEQAPGAPWTSATRTGVASITKGWAVMCVHKLYDAGEVTLDMKVADVWPEFAAQGKQDVTLSQIMNHTNGVIGLPDVAAVVKWDGAGWDDLDAIAAALASAKPAWEPGTKCGYHAVTFGWLVGEIVRRITGRTLGTFFHDEIAKPLNVRCQIGVPRNEQGDIAKSIPGDELMAGPFFLKPILRKVPAKLRDPNELAGQAFLADGTRSIMDSIDDLMVDGRWQEAEVPASNGVTSAVDLAHLWIPQANGGAIDGKQIYSPESMVSFLKPGPVMVDSVMGGLTNIPILKQLVLRAASLQRTVGGYDMNLKKTLGPNKNTIGGGGAGGHIVWADPEVHVTGAFVRSAMDPTNTTQAALVNALYDCLAKA